MTRHAIGILVLCLSFCSTARADELRSVRIPIVLHMDGRITLAVRVNGAGPFRFRLDTGASRTVVAARLAASLGLPSAGTTRVITQTSETAGRLVRMDEVSLTTDLAVGATALVVADHDLDPERAIHGLLGQDVLSHWPYTIDYAAGLLTFAEPSPANGQTVRLPLARVSGGLVAVIPQRNGERSLRLVPDSGADRTVLFRSGHRLPPLTLIDTVRVRSVTGEGIARLVRVHGLDLGGLRVPDHDGLLLEPGAATAAMGDGLLPLHLFARASFNIPAGYLVLEARQ
jgi:predicted aspartyl protease